MSEHADSVGAPTACEDNGVPNVGYNIDFSAVGPNTALISSKINWTPYMQMAIEKVNGGAVLDTEAARALMKAGFYTTPKGLRYRV